MADRGQAPGGTAAGDAETDRDADELRDAMVDQIVAELGEGLPEPLVAALRTVPRHLFTPGVPLARAYDGTTIITKTSERGVSLSSVSTPWIVAGMLAQLDVRPGGVSGRAPGQWWP